jgi:ubiquinone biosynthesis protein COQ4
MALANPLRDDMVAVLGETTAGPALSRMRDKMRADPVGLQILTDRPAITSDSLDVHKLRLMPDGSFGREYQRHMDDLAITADTRKPVRFVDDEECAFVAQRYRETHDFVHCLVGLGVRCVACIRG